MILGNFFFLILFCLHSVGVLAIGAAILTTIGVLSAMLLRGIERLKSASYASFFLGGVTVAHLQWMIFSEHDQFEVRLCILATIALVFVTSLIGIHSGWRYMKEEKLIQIIMIMTVVLAILQFSGIPYQALNWYARVYAVVCLAAPIIKLIRGPKKYDDQKTSADIDRS